jgi:hypothetical protein
VRVAGVAPNISIAPFDHTIGNLERAVKERVFFVKNVSHKTGVNDEFTRPPQPVAEAFSRLGETKRILTNYLPSTAPLTHQQFVDAYKGRKRTVYENALQELRLGNHSLAEDAKVNVFIKHEKTDWTTKQNPVPRVISPRNPRYNIRVGRYLKPIEERVFKALGKLFGHRTVMKGMDVVQTAAVLRQKWEMFSDPVAVGLDASRFDQHVSVPALQFEHSVYLDCFKQKKHKDRLRRLLEYQLRNHCVGYAEDGMLEYITEGTRMSGDMNTSLGNCVLMCSMIHAYLLEKNICGQLANNGDDCVVIIERKDLQKFSENLFDWFWDMGFNMAIEQPVDEFENIEFCQCRPVWDGEAWIMCRNPVSSLAKDAVLLKSNVSEDYFRLWLNAVGTGGLAIAGGIPVFQSFYQMCVRNGIEHYRAKGSGKKVSLVTTEHLPWFMRETGMKGLLKSKPVSDQCRASFWAAWGLVPDAQVALEKYYDELVIGGFGENWLPRPIFTEVEDC